MTEFKPWLRVVNPFESTEKRTEWRTPPTDFPELVSFSESLLVDLDLIKADHATAMECAEVFEALNSTLQKQIGNFNLAEISANHTANFIHVAWLNLHKLFNEVNENNTFLSQQISETLSLLLNTQAIFAKRVPETAVAPPSDAFKSLLRLYRAVPQFQDEIEHACVLPTQISYAADWKTRAEDQTKLDAIGEKLKGLHSTPELLSRLGPLIRSELIMCNPTIYIRRPLDLNSIYDRIVNFVATYSDVASPNPGLELRAKTKKAKDATIIIPTFGDFSTPTIVARDTEQEWEKFKHIYTLHGDEISARHCESWQHLVWYVDEVVKPEREFRFTIKNPADGADSLRYLKGTAVRNAVLDAPYNREPATHLPDASQIAYIRPEDEILPEIRASLNNLFD